MIAPAPLVFLVDDDDDYLEVGRAVLTSAGYRVACFHRPEQALREAERGAPDLVITDLMMDSLDAGIHLARAFKSHPRLAGVPVLLVTGMTHELGLDISPQGKGELDALSADAFLSKPTRPAELLRAARQLLGRSR